MANVTDDFNRTHGSAIGGSTASDGVSVWTTHGGTWLISSSKADPGAGVTERCTVDAGVADVDVSVEFDTTNGANYFGMLVRYLDASNYLLFEGTDSNSRLIRRSSGTNTTVATSLGAVSNGDIFRVNAVGDQVTVYKTPISTGIEGLLTGPHTITQNETNTRHGLYSNFAGSCKLDNFSVVDLTVSSSFTPRRPLTGVGL
jgi:hypothetical protein